MRIRFGECIFDPLRREVLQAVDSLEAALNALVRVVDMTADAGQIGPIDADADLTVDAHDVRSRSGWSGNHCEQGREACKNRPAPGHIAC